MWAAERFPLRMRSKPRWIGWVWGAKEPSGRWITFDLDALEPRDGHLWHRTPSGTLEQASKLPKSVNTMRAASVSDPSTWSTFEAALDALRRGAVHGLGYVLDAGEVLLDIDGCMDDREPDAFSRAIIAKLDSYTERSVSGQGVHILCVADGFTPDRGQKGERVEVYVGGHTKRFCTVSGDVLEGFEDLNDDAEDVLTDVYVAEFGDRPVITDEARATSERFLREARLRELTDDDSRAVAWMCGHFRHARAMFERGDYLGWANDRAKYQPDKDRSQSAADAALTAYLLAATEGDPDRTLALLHKSGMWRPKYDEIHDGRSCYCVMTVANTVKHVDVRLMRHKAFERRDARLDRLVERRPDMRELADLMRRDDVTVPMLCYVMTHHTTGAIQQASNRPLDAYPSEFVPWAIQRWPQIVGLAYRYDLGVIDG